MLSDKILLMSLLKPFKNLIICGIVLATTVVLGCHQNNAPVKERKVAQKPSIGLAAPGDIGASEHDAEFALDANNISIYEIELSKLAMRKSSNQKVKDFAKNMVAALSHSSKKLNQISTSKNIRAAVQLDSLHAQVYQGLAGVDHRQFDKYFFKEIQKSQQQHLKLLETQKIHALDDDLKAYAIENIPIVKNNLLDLKKID